jgi:hypothetical protein
LYHLKNALSQVELEIEGKSFEEVQKESAKKDNIQRGRKSAKLAQGLPRSLPKQLNVIEPEPCMQICQAKLWAKLH